VFYGNSEHGEARVQHQGFLKMLVCTKDPTEFPGQLGLCVQLGGSSGSTVKRLERGTMVGVT